MTSLVGAPFRASQWLAAHMLAMMTYREIAGTAGENAPAERLEPAAEETQFEGNCPTLSNDDEEKLFAPL